MTSYTLETADALIRTSFSTLDTDKSNTLDYDEVSAFLADLLGEEKVDDEMLKGVWETIDEDKNGVADQREFYIFMMRLLSEI
eukprot:g11305.t1